MELRDLTAVLWKRKALIIFVMILTAALSVVFALTRPTRYEATSTIALTPNIAEVGFVAPDTLDALVGTYAQTIKSSLLLDRGAEQLGRRLPGSVDTTTEQGTGILRITGNSSTPEGAAETAQAVSLAFLGYLERNAILKPQIVNPATPPSSPVQPRPPLIITIGIFLGLIGGAMLAYVVDQFRRKVETSGDIAELTSAPVIGRIPEQRRLSRAGATLVWHDPDLAPMHEAFRALRTNVEVLVGRRAAVLVTSATAGEGKSMMVANLGVALSQVGIDTLIVDADLRRPMQHRIFGADNAAGLATLLENPRAPIRFEDTHYPGLSILPSGPVPVDSTEKLHVRFPTVLESLRGKSSFVLIDSPPVLPVSDARLIAGQVDGLLLAVSAGAEKPSALRSTLEKLEFSGASILGVVLNRSDEDFATVGYDAYRSRYSSVPPADAVNRPLRR